MEDATVLEDTPARKLAEAEAAEGPDIGPVTLVRTAGLNVHLKGSKSLLLEAKLRKVCKPKSDDTGNTIKLI